MCVSERLLQLLQEGALGRSGRAALAHRHAPGGLRLKAPHMASCPTHMLGHPLQDLHTETNS